VRRPLISNLALLIAGASLTATLPTAGLASPLEERISVERMELSRMRRPPRKNILQLAAKKKKKKKKAASSGRDDSSTTPGETDEASSSGADTGGSNDDVQKAARVNPAPSSAATSDDQPVSKKPAKGAKVEADVSTPAESGPSGPVGRYLDVSVGGHAFSRSLSYHQQTTAGMTPMLREYQPRLLGDAVLALQYYPAAQFGSDGFVSNIALEVNVEQAFGIQSRTPDGSNFPTSIHDYNGGVRLRLPLESLTPYLSVGYGDHAYTMSGSTRSTLILPDTDYKYVRAAVGVLLPLAGGVSVGVSGGYRYVMSAGNIKTAYFPNLNVGGVEGNLYVGYALDPTFEVRVGFDYRRYFYTMHSKNGDPFIVGGAIDQTYAGSLSLAITLGSSGPSSSSSSSSEDAPPPPKKTKKPKMEDAAGE
jgi:hypothetical protein